MARKGNAGLSCVVPHISGGGVEAGQHLAACIYEGILFLELFGGGGREKELDY